MIDKRYPHYKPTGTAWLGDVPSHWNLERLGLHFHERRTKVSDKDYPPLSVTKNGVVPQLETAAKTDDGDNRKLVKNGDFVINGRSDRKGSSGLSKLDGSASLINIVLQPAASVFPEFCHYLLRSTAFQEEFYRMGNGLVADLWSTHFSDMKNIRLALPPIEEQLDIAAFLASETTRIDSLVKKKIRFIELLKEKRKNLIRIATTKGIDNFEPTKYSGIAQLGHVPEHWTVTRLGRYAKLLGGFAFSSDDFQDEGIPVVRMNNLDRGRLNLSYAAHISYSKVVKSAELKVGDLLWGMSGSLGDTGSLGNFARVQVDDVPCQLNQRVGKFIANEKTLSLDYLTWIIQSTSFYEQIQVLSTGSAQFNVSSSQVERCIYCFPPIEEQERIAKYLCNKSFQLDSLINKIEASIELLNEHRSALITAAVTGKIDVRNSK